ncbi:hypothetical protein AX15_007407 [Amanita polypyramis BW_CC]|nr:hypothetical protein AX15_007407 [Amanita polypyramis BW_CC]
MALTAISLISQKTYLHRDIRVTCAGRVDRICLLVFHTRNLVYIRLIFFGPACGKHRPITMKISSTCPSINSRGARPRRKTTHIHKCLKNVIPEKHLSVWAERLGDSNYAKRTASGRDGGVQNALYSELDFRPRDGRRTSRHKDKPYCQDELAVPGSSRLKNHTNSRFFTKRVPQPNPATSIRGRSASTASSSEGLMDPMYNASVSTFGGAGFDEPPVFSASAFSGALIDTLSSDEESYPFLGVREDTSAHDTVTPSDVWSDPYDIPNGSNLQSYPDVTYHDFYYGHRRRNIHGASIGDLLHTNQRTTSQAYYPPPTNTFSSGYSYFQPDSAQYDNRSSRQPNLVAPPYVYDPTADQ